MNVLDELLELAEERFCIDWPATHAATRRRLGTAAPLPAEVFDPRRYPTYWCVPVLVGSYVDAPPSAVTNDLEPFFSGCLVRHFMFDVEPAVAMDTSDEVVRLASSSYDGCRLTSSAATFEDRFAAKCRPWTMLVALGTLTISEASEGGRAPAFLDATQAIVGVYSCLQVLDDWHDRTEDARRRHWNMWLGEDGPRTRAMIAPLLANASRAVERLQPHLLRRSLHVQLRDAAAELGDLVHLPPATPPPHAVSARQDRDSRSAVRYLDAQLDEDAGMWRDFQLDGVSSGSTECVSAFVATQLADIPSARRLTRAVAARLVANDRVSGGWGYREDVPADCDSTAWVLLAATATGITVPASVAEYSQKFILDHQRRDGGFATYGEAAKAALKPADQPEWFSPEVSVTSSAVLALCARRSVEKARIARAVQFIVDNVSDGVWSSFWWKGFGYGTYVACRALMTAAETRHAGVVDATCRALLRRRNDDGGWGTDGAASDSFSTACAMRTLSLRMSSFRTVIRESARWLHSAHVSSGAWPAGAQMLAPGARNGRDVVLADHGIVTTAIAAAAIHEMSGIQGRGAQSGFLR